MSYRSKNEGFKFFPNAETTWGFAPPQCHVAPVPVEDPLPKKCKSKVKLAIRILILILVPIIAISLAAIFNAAKDQSEAPQHLEFAIPTLLFAFAVLAWALYRFIYLSFLIFNQKLWTKRRKDDKPSMGITLFAVFEIILLALYSLILLAYAIYLFDNQQYVDTYQVRSAYLVEIGTSHLWILFIFTDYIVNFFIGGAISNHIAVKAWAMALNMLCQLWAYVMSFLILGSVVGIIAERRDRERSDGEV